MIVVKDRQLVIVTVAIDLDYQLQSVAVKVSNVWPDRVLAAELPIAEASIAQQTQTICSGRVAHFRRLRAR